MTMKCAASAGAGDEPFAAADHPFAVFLLGKGADHARIGAAARRRLGHGEGRFDFALDDRPQPPFLLRRRAGARQQIHIAVVGRRAVDRQRAEQRARRFLIDRRPGDDRQRHAAEFLGRLRRPQPGFSCLAPAPAPAGERDVLVLGKIFGIGFERQHMRLDESARALPQILDFGRKSEVHAGAPPLIFIKAGIGETARGYREAKGGVEIQGERHETDRMCNRRRGGAACASECRPATPVYGDAPWCAVMNIGTGEMYWDCQYQTFDACVPNVIAGNRGFCNVNPTYVPAAVAPASHYARHHPPKHS